MIKSNRVREAEIGGVTVGRYGMSVKVGGQEFQLPFRSMREYSLRRRWFIGKPYVRIVMDNCVYRVNGTDPALKALMKIIEHKESIYNSH